MADKTEPVTQNIAIDRITVDDRLQHRADAKGKKDSVNPERVKEYAKLQAEGIPFPPVKIVKEGSTLWLYSGFHTLAGHVKNGKDKIRAEIVAGTFRDALRLSYAENIGPAMRTDETIRMIIEELARDPEWRDWTNEVIAKHVGVSRETVRRWRSPIEKELAAAAEEAARAAKEEAKRRRAAGETDVPEPDETPEPERTRTVTRKGKTYTMKVGKVGRKKKKVSSEAGADGKTKPEDKAGFRDALGNLAPEDLQDVFGTTLVETVADGIEELVPLVSSVERWNPWLNVVEVTAWMRQVVDAVRAAKPHAVCPACRGEKCPHCRHSGFVPEHSYEEALAHAAAEEPETAEAAGE